VREREESEARGGRDGLAAEGHDVPSTVDFSVGRVRSRREESSVIGAGLVERIVFVTLVTVTSSDASSTSPSLARAAFEEGAAVRDGNLVTHVDAMARHAFDPTASILTSVRDVSVSVIKVPAEGRGGVDVRPVDEHDLAGES